MYNKVSPSTHSATESRSPKQGADMGEIDYESLPTNNLWQHLLAGAMAGLMEHCAVYPVDCVKVRVGPVCIDTKRRCLRACSLDCVKLCNIVSAVSNLTTCYFSFVVLISCA